jgi:hypothetical protein
MPKNTPKKLNRHSRIFISPKLIDKKSKREASHIALIRKDEQKQFSQINPPSPIHSKPLSFRDASQTGGFSLAEKLKAAVLPTVQSSPSLTATTLPAPPVLTDDDQPKEFKISPRLKPIPPPSQPTLPKPDAQATSQYVRVFALAKVRQLLNVVARGSFVAFDIDETLVITRNMPSELLQPHGVQEFQQYVRSQFADFSSRNQHCRALQTALKDKITVEEDTAEVFRELTARGCRMFAITARFSELADRTEAILDAFGMCFKKTSPFNLDRWTDPVTEAVLQNGIIYCNGDDKGTILARVLSQLLFSNELRQLCDSSSQTSFPPPIPGFFFLDDRVEHTHSVAKSLDALVLLKVPSIVFHYRPPVSMLIQSHSNLHASRPEVLALQMDHFVATGLVLSNVAALAKLDESKPGSPDLKPTKSAPL